MQGRLITAAQALDMLQTVAPRSWARRMLAWHVFETTGTLLFASGQAVEKMYGFSLLEWAKVPICDGSLGRGVENLGPSIEAVRRAEQSDKSEVIEVERRELSLPVEFPVELSAGMEIFDWEQGITRGSLHNLEIAEYYEEPIPQRSDSWIDVDLSGLCFDLHLIEMLAPSASVPTQSLFATSAESPGGQKRGGPGRRRHHDWDGVLLYLIGEAERNEIAPDPDAHGAQADVANMMADWFAAQGSPVPVSSQLQTMAKRVLEHIRAA